MPSRPLSWWLGATAVLLYAALLWAYHAGNDFSAVSDDDYARVVIAQRWVDAPSLDPSGTSWLPLPFLLEGIVFSLLSPTLTVARALAVVLAWASCAALYVSLRQIRVSPAWSAGASVAALSFPTALPFGWATVPELWAAALVTIAGVSLLARPGSRFEWWGGCAVLAATASRYEAWPAAAVLSLHHGMRMLRAIEQHAPASRQRRPTRLWRQCVARSGLARSCLASLGLALLPMGFIITWMVYGSLHHGSALFFLQRVSDYKAALGDSVPSWWELLWGYPEAFVLREPEIVLLTFLAAVLLWLRPPRAGHVGRRLGWLVLAQLAFLMVGAVRGGVPTHHAERTLLAPWMLCIVFCALVATRWGSRRQPLQRLLAGLLGVALLVSITIRLSSEPSLEDWSLRKDHERLGAQIRRELPAQERVALALEDYGYFAVMAAATRPERFEVLDRHDPREPHAGRTLSEWAKHTEDCHFVTSLSLGLAPPSRVLWRAGQLQLRQLARCRVRH